MERNEEKVNKKKIEAIIKSEKEKWSALKKHQEDKKRKANFQKYDKYIVQEPNQMRILVIGESCSGKTCLIKRFIKDEFDPEYKTTILVEGFKSDLLYFEDASYRIELIDTPPLENFYKYLEDMIYFAQGVILVFDASNKNAFLRMQDYFKMISFYEFQRIGIIATKKDICTEKDKYKYYQLQKFCQQYKAIHAFISVKTNKDEISNFIDALCPEIIPSLVNNKEELKMQYPYTKSVKNDFPKKNMIDEAIIKKAKEDDSSYYGSEDSKDKEKDKEQEIKEFYLRKKQKQEKKPSKPKINYIYNVGNANGKKYREDMSLEEKKEELQDFNSVIGNVNLDLEKLFEKYRPESGSLMGDGKKRRKKIKGKNKTIEEEGGGWVNMNIDTLVDEFMKTKIKEKKNKKDKKDKDKDKDKDKKVQKSDISKNIKSLDNKEEEEKSEEKEKSEKTKSKKSSKSKSKKEENNSKNVSNEKNSQIEKKSESKKISQKESEKEEEQKDYNSEDDLEDVYGDIYDFQQSLMEEAMGEQQFQ